MSPAHKISSLLLVLLLTLVTTTCGSRHDSDENYYMVGANIKLPYWENASAGLSAAATQLQVRAAFVGPDTYDAKAEKQTLDDLIAKKPAGILVSVTDPEILGDSIDTRIPAGFLAIRSSRVCFSALAS